MFALWVALLPFHASGLEDEPISHRSNTQSHKDSDFIHSQCRLDIVAWSKVNLRSPKHTAEFLSANSIIYLIN